MKIAEKLYTSGFISYPRTETDSFSKRINLRSILDKLKGNEDYSEYLGTMEYSHPRSGKKNDEAHPPIHPVKDYTASKDSLEYRVFDLISRRFIACCSKDAVIQEGVVTA